METLLERSSYCPRRCPLRSCCSYALDAKEKRKDPLSPISCPIRPQPSLGSALEDRGCCFSEIKDQALPTTTTSTTSFILKTMTSSTELQQLLSQAAATEDGQALAAFLKTMQGTLQGISKDMVKWEQLYSNKGVSERPKRCLPPTPILTTKRQALDQDQVFAAEARLRRVCKSINEVSVVDPPSPYHH